MRILLLLFFFFLMIAALSSNAQSTYPTSATLTWEPALTFVDGTPLDESQIEGYPLYCDGAHVATLSNDFTRRYVISTALLGPGEHRCTLSEVVNGLESVASNEVAFILGQPAPRAPTLTVE